MHTEPMNAPASTVVADNDSKIIIKNSAILLIRRAFLWIFAGVMALFLPRYLGAEGLGQLAFAEAFAGLFTSILSLGLSQFLIKEVARDRTAIERYLGISIVLHVITGLLLAGIILGATTFTNFGGEARSVMYIVTAAAITLSFVRLITHIFSGLENMTWPATAEVLSKVLVVSVGIFVLVHGYGVAVYASVLLGATIINLILITRGLSRRFSLQFGFKLPTVKTLLIGGAPFILMGVLLDVYNQVDTIILRIFTDDATVGWFAAANRIYKTIDMLPLAFTAAMFPTLSRVHASDIEHSVSIAKRSISTGALVIIPLALGVSLFSREIIEILPYPDGFQNTIPLLTVLSLTIPFTAFLVILGTIAMAIDRQKAWAMALLGTLVLNIILNVILVQIFQNHFGNGGIGIAISTLFSEAIMVVIGVRLMPKGVIDKALVITLARVGIAGAGMAVVVLSAKGLGAPEIPLVAIGGITYIVFAFAVKAVTKRDIELIRSVVSRRSKGIRARN